MKTDEKLAKRERLFNKKSELNRKKKLKVPKIIRVSKPALSNLNKTKQCPENISQDNHKSNDTHTLEKKTSQEINMFSDSYELDNDILL